MKKYAFILILSLSFLAIGIPGHSEEKAPVFVAEVEGIINPATAKFIVESIDQAVKEGGQCLIIEMDTPGG